MSELEVVRDLWRELDKRGVDVNAIQQGKEAFSLIVLVEVFEDIRKLPMWFQDYSVVGFAKPEDCGDNE